MIKNIKWLLLVSLTFVACNSDEEDTSGVVPEVPVTAGTADFSNYVSLGNSITAGYADGALFMAGQANSYPKLLSDQFALVGGGPFTIPYMNDNIGGLVVGGFQIQGTRLIFNGSAPVNLPGTPTTDVLNHLTGPFNNLGVPGAKSFHLLANGYGNIAGVLSGQANPYFVRFATSSSTTVLADALAQNPTFFSLWIGNNDVLSYALSGGTGTNQTGNMNPATYGSNDITDPTAFAGVYSTLLDGLTSNGAKGVVANIPYVSAVPFFTTVPVKAIPELPVSDAAQLNQLFGAINQITTALGQPKRFVELIADDSNPLTSGKNPLLINDETLPDLSTYITATLTPVLGGPTATYVGGLYGRARHARLTTGDRDYILLTASSIIGTNQAGAPSPFNIIGISNPMQDNRTLTAAEVAEIKTAVDAYNISIKALADAKGLAYVDANTALNDVADGGVIFDNFHMTSDFVKGGAFGLDGVHPSARGQAYIANKFIEAINAKYGSTLRKYKAQDFPLSYPAGL
jgi:lysophospholipase L1-like esterase